MHSPKYVRINLPARTSCLLDTCEIFALCMLTSITLQVFRFLSNPCNLQTKGVFIYWTALGFSFLLPGVINLTRQQQLLFNLSKLVCQRQSVWRSYPRSILIIPMNHSALYETEQLNSWHRMSQALNAASIYSCKQ